MTNPTNRRPRVPWSVLALEPAPDWGVWRPTDENPTRDGLPELPHPALHWMPDAVPERAADLDGAEDMIPPPPGVLHWSGIRWTRFEGFPGAQPVMIEAHAPPLPPGDLFGGYLPPTMLLVGLCEAQNGYHVRTYWCSTVHAVARVVAGELGDRVYYPMVVAAGPLTLRAVWTLALHYLWLLERDPAVNDQTTSRELSALLDDLGAMAADQLPVAVCDPGGATLDGARWLAGLLGDPQAVQRASQGDAAAVRDVRLRALEAVLERYGSLSGMLADVLGDESLVHVHPLVLAEAVASMMAVSASQCEDEIQDRVAAWMRAAPVEPLTWADGAQHPPGVVL